MPFMFVFDDGEPKEPLIEEIIDEEDDDDEDDDDDEEIDEEDIVKELPTTEAVELEVDPDDPAKDDELYPPDEDENHSDGTAG